MNKVFVVRSEGALVYKTVVDKTARKMRTQAVLDEIKAQQKHCETLSEEYTKKLQAKQKAGLLQDAQRSELLQIQ